MEDLRCGACDGVIESAAQEVPAHRCRKCGETGELAELLRTRCVQARNVPTEMHPLVKAQIPHCACGTMLVAAQSAPGQACCRKCNCTGPIAELGSR